MRWGAERSAPDLVRQAELVVPVTFLTIVSTVAVYGLLAAPLAGLLVVAAVVIVLAPLASDDPDGLERVAIDAGFAEQGSEVVGELLLFARSDDTVAPVAFDLAALVSDQRAVLNHLLPDEVDLEIETGEILCLLGENGAGKSTLLRAIVGLAKRGGDVVIDGATVKPRVAEFRKRFLELRYCFDEGDLAERAGVLHSLY